MKPQIDGTAFGSITVEGETLEHDILIRLDGTVKKRKKRLSKEVYGTSHVISLEEAKHVFEEGARRLILGAGQNGEVRLSHEASEYFSKRGCRVDRMVTPEAVKAWNEAEGPAIALFHVTC